MSDSTAEESCKTSVATGESFWPAAMRSSSLYSVEDGKTGESNVKTLSTLRGSKRECLTTPCGKEPRKLVIIGNLLKLNVIYVELCIRFHASLELLDEEARKHG